MLNKEVERLGIQERPECLYNCDESGFLRDPTKCKYVGPIVSHCLLSGTIPSTFNSDCFS